MDTDTRAEHLQWCKDRALDYVERGELTQALASMTSDLQKHPETAGHAGSQLGLGLMMTGDLSTGQQMREYINGFN